MNVSPSNNTKDAEPKDESDSAPDIINILSDSTILLELCVFCRGTMNNWEMFELA